MFNELVLQTRLRYLAFKRLTWIAETLVLLILALVLLLLDVSFNYYLLILGVQGLRVVTELINHYHLSGEFNVRDRWHLYPFI